MDFDRDQTARLSERHPKAGGEFTGGNGPASACGGGKRINVASTMLWHTETMPVPDSYDLALRQADQARTDFANIEITLEFLIQRINALPTARDLWRAATLLGLIGAVLGIVGIEAFWRYFACGSI